MRKPDNEKKALSAVTLRKGNDGLVERLCVGHGYCCARPRPARHGPLPMSSNVTLYDVEKFPTIAWKLDAGQQGSACLRVKYRYQAINALSRKVELMRWSAAE